jgi:amidophosphoribosyltransferase
MTTYSRCFAQINDRINEEMVLILNMRIMSLQKQIFLYRGELFLGHVRYGTFGKNSIEVFILFTSEQLDAQI